MFAAIASFVVMSAGSSRAFAQMTYKAGDRIEGKVSGEWVKAEVRKVEANGSLFIRYDGSSVDVLTFPDFVRPAQAATPIDNRKGSNPAQNQPTPDQPAPNAPKGNQPAPQPNQAANANANKYGTRDARTCKEMKAPVNGAVTAALAQTYVVCDREKISGPYLHLVENVKAEVAAGRPYNPNLDINFPEIDVRFPVYPIRGSLTSYQCYAVNPNFTVSLPGKNCIRYEEPQSKGFCYKTTFGDWRCHMADLSYTNENFFPGVAPPKPEF